MSSFESKPFGEVQVGDALKAPGGEVTVKTVYDEHTPERMYELELEDGSTVKASGTHLWYIETDEDRLAHSTRVGAAKKLLKGHKEWIAEAEEVAVSATPYEISVDDLMTFFDFIEDEALVAHFVQRICSSIGHIAEEEVTYQDYFTHETESGSFAFIYDARRFFQQALALTGQRKYRKKWPVIVGRVADTDTIYTRYPDASIPTL